MHGFMLRGTWPLGLYRSRHYFDMQNFEFLKFDLTLEWPVRVRKCCTCVSVRYEFNTNTRFEEFMFCNTWLAWASCILNLYFVWLQDVWYSFSRCCMVFYFLENYNYNSCRIKRFEILKCYRMWSELNLVEKFKSYSRNSK